MKYGDSWLVQTSTMCVVDMVWVLMARWTRVLLANAYWHYSFQFACMTWHRCSGILAKLFRLTSTTTNLLVRGYEQSTRLSRWVKHSSKPCGTEGKDKTTESGLRAILLTSLASHLLCSAELSGTNCGKLVSLIAIRSTTRLMLFRVWLALCATMSLTTHVDLQIDDFLNNATMKPSFSYMHRIAKYLFKAVLVHFKVIRMLAHNSLNNITLQWIHGLLVLPNMRGRSSTFKILSISSLWMLLFRHMRMMWRVLHYANQQQSFPSNSRRRTRSCLPRFGRLVLHRMWGKQVHVPCFVRQGADTYTRAVFCEDLLPGNTCRMAKYLGVLHHAIGNDSPEILQRIRSADIGWFSMGKFWFRQGSQGLFRHRTGSCVQGSGLQSIVIWPRSSLYQQIASGTVGQVCH